MQLLETLRVHAEESAVHYIRGTLPPNPRASHRLLAYLPESGQSQKALEFWQWLSRQDGSFLNWDTHGIALEVMARAGSSLARCEELYMNAIKALPPGVRVEPFLNGSMLPRSMQASFFRTPRLALSRGIFFTPIRHGDWRNAYLSIDVIFGVWTTAVDDRVLEIAIAFRTVHESYQIFCLYCKAGAHVRPKSLKSLLDKLNKSSSAVRRKQTRGLVLESLDLIKAIVQALETYRRSRRC